ncbi:UDP-N-acetylmuramoyl-tripeptide--D-alanyl-D-alanine ligase [Paracoccus suum]|uniref:UDP-N-acetylmuramoyl-tripeptide--D-alanyl-D-alanine ligase n=1 Tax=Paracoccus suum TaxID=2259340 RepID=A0A344PJL8_9RHOB|nr:UDP-N-acetylmuramoyl-tripeptide--D-alanyl-D-alanine ligase [Paracoccus suum]AXC49573.1 UDP-N-acetylmuramoyl-tripeptide--D-alanyl-D-alanine ligase [Paracoccus suum]
MSVLWTAADAAAATGGVTGEWQASGISIDTRTLRPGDLFVALTDVRDGHDFVAAALEKGAAAALVSRVPEGCDPGRLLLVPEVLPALEALGRAGRARTGARVLAITGSVGKTSTKDMAVAALQELPTGPAGVHAAEASLNNHWGVPLTLARMPRDTSYAVLEIGMNHPGEIEPLARMARPHVALITTVAAAHLEAFASIDEIAVEKAAIFRGLEPAGIAVLPEGLAVTPILREGAANAEVRSFGHRGDNRLIAAEARAGQTEVQAQIGGRPITFSLASVGEHFALNAVGVLAALDALGVDPLQAAAGLANWRPYAGRGAIEGLAGVTLLDDSYNSNPASLSAGLAMLARLPGARRIAILGDMLELGPDEIAMHAAMAGDPAMASVDLVHACGPRMRALLDALPPAKRGIWAEDAAELRARAGDLARTGDIVLIKGSKSSRVASVVDALRQARQSPPSHEQG